MKIRKRAGQQRNHKDRRTRQEGRRDLRDRQVTELLKTCLQKVCELQADLEQNKEQENDPECAGYAACAIETLRFLSAEGLSADHPVVKQLTETLFRNRD